MKKFIGIKLVTAVAMMAAEAKEKGYRIGKAEAETEGLEVTYEDGYKSWCPKDVFEARNFEVKNEVLAGSCAMMMSPDFKERFKAEYAQLKNRREALMAMVEKMEAGTLSFAPACPYELFQKQLVAMGLYQGVLMERAELEGIDLSGL